jgi:hypothetical protein
MKLHLLPLKTGAAWYLTALAARQARSLLVSSGYSDGEPPRRIDVPTDKAGLVTFLRENMVRLPDVAACAETPADGVTVYMLAKELRLPPDDLPFVVPTLAEARTFGVKAAALRTVYVPRRKADLVAFLNSCCGQDPNAEGRKAATSVLDDAADESGVFQSPSPGGEPGANAASDNAYKGEPIAPEYSQLSDKETARRFTARDNLFGMLAALEADTVHDALMIYVDSCTDAARLGDLAFAIGCRIKALSGGA